MVMVYDISVFAEDDYCNSFTTCLLSITGINVRKHFQGRKVEVDYCHGIVVVVIFVIAFIKV